MTAKTPECKDCRTEAVALGEFTDFPRTLPKRKLAVDRNGKLQPGPRCVTHYRAFKKKQSAAAHARSIEEKYGITAEEYARLYETQGGLCAICRRARGISKRLSVDHDHADGRVRGLLCTKCNKMLGEARDDTAFFQRAINYLISPPFQRMAL